MKRTLATQGGLPPQQTDKERVTQRRSARRGRRRAAHSTGSSALRSPRLCVTFSPLRDWARLQASANVAKGVLTHVHLSATMGLPDVSAIAYRLPAGPAAIALLKVRD